ncbi:MAG: hypothetical protein ACRDCY_13115, partial [Aeromonas veronii]
MADPATPLCCSVTFDWGHFPPPALASKRPTFGRFINLIDLRKEEMNKIYLAVALACWGSAALAAQEVE